MRSHNVQFVNLFVEIFRASSEEAAEPETQTAERFARQFSHDCRNVDSNNGVPADTPIPEQVLEERYNQITSQAFEWLRSRVEDDQRFNQLTGIMNQEKNLAFAALCQRSLNKATFYDSERKLEEGEVDTHPEKRRWKYTPPGLSKLRDLFAWDSSLSSGLKVTFSDNKLHVSGITLSNEADQNYLVAKVKESGISPVRFHGFSASGKRLRLSGDPIKGEDRKEWENRYALYDKAVKAGIEISPSKEDLKDSPQIKQLYDSQQRSLKGFEKPFVHDYNQDEEVSQAAPSLST